MSDEDFFAGDRAAAAVVSGTARAKRKRRPHKAAECMPEPLPEPPAAGSEPSECEPSFSASSEVESEVESACPLEASVVDTIWQVALMVVIMRLLILLVYIVVIVLVVKFVPLAQSVLLSLPLLF